MIEFLLGAGIFGIGALFGAALSQIAISRILDADKD